MLDTFAEKLSTAKACLLFDKLRRSKECELDGGCGGSHWLELEMFMVISCKRELLSEM